VQMDDAYLGGEKAGKRGRGAANKVPFIIAVETRDGKPIHTQLRCIPALTKEAMKDYAAVNLVAGSSVTTDGLACFSGVAEAGTKHTAQVSLNSNGSIRVSATSRPRSRAPAAHATRNTPLDTSPHTSIDSPGALISIRWSSVSPPSLPKPRPGLLKPLLKRRHRGNQVLQ
jgi:hypothetical protein